MRLGSPPWLSHYPPPQLVPPAEEGMSGDDDMTVSWDQRFAKIYKRFITRLSTNRYVIFYFMLHFIRVHSPIRCQTLVQADHSAEVKWICLNNWFVPQHQAPGTQSHPQHPVPRDCHHRVPPEALGKSKQPRTEAGKKNSWNPYYYIC